MEIREERPEDIAAIRDVNNRAFGQEQESNIVDALRSNGGVLLSLVATLVGHVVGRAALHLGTEQLDLRGVDRGQLTGRVRGDRLIDQCLSGIDVGGSRSEFELGVLEAADRLTKDDALRDVFDRDLKRSTRLGHSSRGRKLTNVSTMSSGAGSVGPCRRCSWILPL